MKLIVGTISFLFFMSPLRSQTNFWVNLNIPNDTAVFSVTVNAKGNIYAGGNGTIYSTFNNGLSWSKTDSTVMTGRVDKLIAKNNGLLLGASNNGVLRSTDEGNSWGYLQYNLPNPSVSEIVTDDKENIYAAVVGGALLRSSNNGATWNSLTGDLPNTQFSSLTIGKDGAIFVGLSGYGLYRSTNEGAHWESLNNGLRTDLFTALSITSVVINDSGYIFASTLEGGNFRSKDHGATWKGINAGNPALWTICMAIDSQGTLYAGTSSSGVYFSVNNGDSWTGLNTGLSSTLINDLSIANDGFLYAATLNGLYRSANKVVTSFTAGSTPIDKFEISNNYPNPFNPKTTIEYVVPEQATVKIIVFDILGNEVATLVNKQHRPGSYSATFDASALSSGTYLYRIETAKFTETKKMILLK